MENENSTAVHIKQKNSSIYIATLVISILYEMRKSIFLVFSQDFSNGFARLLAWQFLSLKEALTYFR